MINKFFKVLRLINKKTLNIPIFLIGTHIRVKFQILIFHFYPELARLLSIKTAKLPNKNERFKFNKTQLDEFRIIQKRNFKFNNLDLYIRSKIYSFKDLKRTKNIFLLNPFYMENETKNYLPPSKKKLLIIKKKNIHYVTADSVFLTEYLKYKLKNIVYIQVWKKKGKKIFIDSKEKNIRNKILQYSKKNKNSYLIDVCFETDCQNIYVNSAAIAALVFAKLGKKLTVHNWNYYQTESPKNYGYFKSINLLYPLQYRIKNNVFFEMSLWHYVFAYRLTQQKHVKITGFTKYICKKKEITKRLLKVFYK